MADNRQLCTNTVEKLDIIILNNWTFLSKQSRWTVPCAYCCRKHLNTPALVESVSSATTTLQSRDWLWRSFTRQTSSHWTPTVKVTDQMQSCAPVSVVVGYWSPCVPVLLRSEWPLRHSGALSSPSFPHGQESTHASETENTAPSVWWTFLFVSLIQFFYQYLCFIGNIFSLYLVCYGFERNIFIHRAKLKHLLALRRLGFRLVSDSVDNLQYFSNF